MSQRGSGFSAGQPRAARRGPFRLRCERKTAGLAARGRPPCLRHSLTRRCARRTVRRVGRGPRVNHLAQALTAFNRAVRARCRLMQLAPEIFDTSVVRRHADEQEARRQRLAELEPITQKVYGPATDLAPDKLHHAQTDEWCRNGAEMVQFFPGKIQKIESLLAEREL